MPCEGYRETVLEVATDIADRRLERILGGNDLSDINYLALGLIRARAVGRVVIREGGRLVGYGTGFLVAPGVLMTNRHVLESMETVATSSVQFRYERDAFGNNLDPVEFKFKTSPVPIIETSLDMALVQVESQSEGGNSLADFGWLRLSDTPGKAFVGEYLTIIQHPGGERKQICVRENKLLKFDDNSPFLWYQTDTVGGSSGSPVFNNSWDVVALHHSSVPRTKNVNGKDVWLNKDGKVWLQEMGDDTVDWIANEGVRISRIVDFLIQMQGNHPLSRAIREAVDPPMTESFSVDGSDRGGGIRVRSDCQGNTRISLPIEIGIKLDIGTGLKQQTQIGNARAVPVPIPPTPARTSVATTVATTVEKVDVDQSNYDERTGFDTAFLEDSLIVPLPKVGGSQASKVLKYGSASELKYWNYSVVMHSERKLAFFSAANVHPNLVKGNRDKDGDTWFKDTRISEKSQTGKVRAQINSRSRRC